MHGRLNKVPTHEYKTMLQISHILCLEVPSVLRTLNNVTTHIYNAMLEVYDILCLKILNMLGSLNNVSRIQYNVENVRYLVSGNSKWKFT